VSDLRHKLNTTIAELEDSRKMEAIRHSDSENLVNDLQMLTKENQFVKEELKRAATERD